MEYKTISEKEYYFEIVEKNSRFIGCAVHINEEKQAVDFINKVKTIYTNATHYTYAYILKNGAERFSDDKEPSKTAGLPILTAIKGRSLYDVCVVVVRYFGGILLGTGGLTRAYSKAAKTVLDSCEVCTMVLCDMIKISIEYPYYDIVLKYLNSENIKIIKTEFFDNVVIEILCDKEKTECFINNICNICLGKAEIEKISEKFAIK